MKYIDENGKAFEKETSQDKWLKFLYESFLGRKIVRVMICPWVSKKCGEILSSRVSRIFIKGFVKRNDIDLSIYERQDFKSYNDFFTRKINPKYRKINENKNALISPSDGKLSVYKIDKDSTFEIKNSSYTCESLVKNKSLAEKFQGGYAFVIRLTVDDYHRYCYPCDGQKGENVHIDGFYHTVNPIALEHCQVFKENTREYCTILSETFGEVVQMEVGATLVGKISNCHKSSQRVFKGSEKGKFEFGGSTIILLVKEGAIKPPSRFLNYTSQGFETIIKQGQVLGFKE